MSLDGKWEFATDPDDQGRAGWFKAGTVLARGAVHRGAGLLGSAGGRR